MSFILDTKTGEYIYIDDESIIKADEQPATIEERLEAVEGAIIDIAEVIYND